MVVIIRDVTGCDGVSCCPWPGLKYSTEEPTLYAFRSGAILLAIPMIFQSVRIELPNVELSKPAPGYCMLTDDTTVLSSISYKTYIVRR